MSEHEGARIVQDGGFNKFTWMLLAGFGGILILISSAALTKLFSISDKQSDQAADIRVILTNQNYQGQNVSNLAADIKAIDSRLRAIETRQVEARNAVR